MKLAVLKNWIQNASSSNDNEIILKGLKGMKIHSWRHLPHACFTYSLGFVFTFAGIISPTSKPQHITRSFSLSLSLIYTSKFQLYVLHWILPEWESPWNQRRMCNMSKWAIHPWWLLGSVTREEMYPRGSWKIPTLGIVFYLKTLRHFSSPFIYSKSIYQVLLYQHCVNISKALNLQSSFLLYTYVDTFRWGLKFSTQLNTLVSF